MKKYEHSMSCEWPEGCSCGASEHNELVAKLEHAIMCLKFARRIIGAETANEDTVAKIDDSLAKLQM